MKSKSQVSREKRKIEKMMRQITTQRLKNNLKMNFNLEEGEGGDASGIQLTHGGKPINDQLLGKFS